MPDKYTYICASKITSPEIGLQTGNIMTRLSGSHNAYPLITPGVPIVSRPRF